MFTHTHTQCTVWCSKHWASHKYIWSYAAPFKFSSSADYCGHLIPAPNGQKCHYYCSKTYVFQYGVYHLITCVWLCGMIRNLQVESFALLGCCAVLTGSVLLSSQDNLSVPSDRLSQRSVTNYLTVLCNIPEEQWSHLHHRRSLKLCNLHFPWTAGNLYTSWVSIYFSKWALMWS